MGNESGWKKTVQLGEGEDPELEPSQTQSATSQAGPSTQPQRQGQPRQQAKQSSAEPKPRQQLPLWEFNASVTQGCMDLVEAYHWGDKQRGGVLLELGKQLGLHGDKGNDTTACMAFKTYCTWLVEIDNA